MYNNLLHISSHTEPAPDYIKRSAETVASLHTTEGAGDVLVFLTGAEEVEDCVSIIKDLTASLPKDHVRFRGHTGGRFTNLT